MAGISVCIISLLMLFFISPPLEDKARDFGSFLLIFSFLIVDDARLLLGIYYHGFGNWEKIRLDERLGLIKKIAPVELQHHETFLPRAPNLRDRANALLEMVCNHI